MAFVRWRGNCAELLATVYENGKSRQIFLANFQQNYASDQVRDQVATEHPAIHVDWLAVERALARGPKTKPSSEPPLTLLQTENLLRTIAHELKGDLFPYQTRDLNGAADTLSQLRDDPRIVAICQRVTQPPSADSYLRTNLSSNDLPAARGDGPSQGRSKNTKVSSDDGARPPPPRAGQAGSPEPGSPSPQTCSPVGSLCSIEVVPHCGSCAHLVTHNIQIATD